MTMAYFIVDGMLSGTGIRDGINGGYLDPRELGLSPDLCSRISRWLLRYENAHYYQFRDKDENVSLDAEGINIAGVLKASLPAARISYYSNAELRDVDLEDSYPS
jgi:hypothetical protein